MRIVQILNQVYRLESADFVRELFRQMLARSPSREEAARNLDRLSSEISRNDLLFELFNSEEAYGVYQRAPAKKLGRTAEKLQFLLSLSDESFVSHLYIEFLCRTVGPEDHSECLQYLQEGNSRMPLIAAILSNDEFLQLLQEDIQVLNKKALYCFICSR